MTTLNIFIKELINVLIEGGLIELTNYYNRERIPVESLPQEGIELIKQYAGEELSAYLFNEERNVGALMAISVGCYHNEIDEKRFYFIIKEGWKDCDVFTSYAENFLSDAKIIIDEIK